MITASAIKQMLTDGKTRQQIADHFGVSLGLLINAMKNIPELQGLKTRKVLQIVNDLAPGYSESVTEEVSPVVNAEPVAEKEPVEAGWDN